MLDVFLALVANEWRADANARERAALTRAGVIEEIRFCETFSTAPSASPSTTGASRT